jgi:hypothetical protein
MPADSTTRADGTVHSRGFRRWQGSHFWTKVRLPPGIAVNVGLGCPGVGLAGRRRGTRGPGRSCGGESHAQTRESPAQVDESHTRGAVRVPLRPKLPTDTAQEPQKCALATYPWRVAVVSVPPAGHKSGKVPASDTAEAAVARGAGRHVLQGHLECVGRPQGGLECMPVGSATRVGGRVCGWGVQGCGRGRTFGQKCTGRSLALLYKSARLRPARSNCGLGVGVRSCGVCGWCRGTRGRCA